MKKAVTLIEMITVIGIISILTAIAAPTLSSYLPGVQLNGSTRVLSANLREAQERAVTEQKQHLIRFNLTAGDYYYQMIKIDGENEEIIEKVILPSQETIVLEETISNNQIIFSPDGGPSSSGDISLNINDKSKTINVSPAGFIKVK